jgi:hypothetical protein
VSCLSAYFICKTLDKFRFKSCRANLSLILLDHKISCLSLIRNRVLVNLLQATYRTKNWPTYQSDLQLNLKYVKAVHEKCTTIKKFMFPYHNDL